MPNIVILPQFSPNCSGPDITLCLHVQGSDADNIIPDEVTLRGTLRALTHEHMMLMKQRIEEVSKKFRRAGAGLYTHTYAITWCLAVSSE